MNPLEILYCWQAIIVAVAVYMLTQLTKSLINLRAAPKTERGKFILKRIILPAIPPLIGTAVAIAIPLRPDILNAYVHEHAETLGKLGPYAVYGGWGAAVGQFADYGYSKVSAFFKTPPAAGGE